MDQTKSFQISPANRMTGLPTQFFSDLFAKQRPKSHKDMMSLIWVKAILICRHRHILFKPCKKRQPTRFIIDIRHSAGFLFLKEAIAQRYKEDYNVDLDPETEVAILFGGKTGLIEISQCLLNPGDVCLVPDPGYPDYWSGVALAGGRDGVHAAKSKTIASYPIILQS